MHIHSISSTKYNNDHTFLTGMDNLKIVLPSLLKDSQSRINHLRSGTKIPWYILKSQEKNSINSIDSNINIKEVINTFIGLGIIIIYRTMDVVYTES